MQKLLIFGVALLLIAVIFEYFILLSGIATIIWGIYEWNKNKKMNIPSKMPMVVILVGIMIVLSAIFNLESILILGGLALFIYALFSLFYGLFKRNGRAKLNGILLLSGFIIFLMGGSIVQEEEQAQLAIEQQAKEEEDAKKKAAEEEEAKVAAEKKAEEERLAAEQAEKDRIAAEEAEKKAEEERLAAEEAAAAQLAAEQQAQAEAEAQEAAAQEQVETVRTDFQNCTDVRTVYPDGIPSDHPAYKAKFDRDHDDWGCEVNG